jgi:hypothetical protein
MEGGGVMVSDEALRQFGSEWKSIYEWFRTNDRGSRKTKTVGGVEFHQFPDFGIIARPGQHSETFVTLGELQHAVHEAQALERREARAIKLQEYLRRYGPFWGLIRFRIGI